MNVLIIASNRNQQPVTVMPLGACIVAEAAEKAGHRVSVLDLMFEKNPLSTLEDELDKTNPDVVGISVRNIDNNDMKNPVAFFIELKPLMNSLRRRTKATIVLGGPAIAIMPEEFLRYTSADYAVLGNGDTVFPALLSTIERKDSLKDIDGIAWIEKDIFFKNGLSTAEFSASCHVPDLHRWIDMKAYQSALSTVPIQAKRGCPYKCVYCTYAMSEGSEYHLCEPDSVAEEVRKLVLSGMQDVEFVDNVFNSPYDHALAICESLIRAGIKARLQTVELNPKFVDKTLLGVMEKAGFVGVGITAESASDRVLEGLGKEYTSAQVYAAAESAQRSKIPFFWMFMLGGPGETERTVKETLHFAENRVSSKDVAFFNVGIRIYPGTELERIAREQGLLSLPAKEMFAPVWYFSPFLDKIWLFRTLAEAMNRHLNYINSDSLALPFLTRIHHLAYKLGIKPPIWRHTRSLRGGLRILGVNA
jgi:radical SAM superfamily enzyme YgiQ (UPF0313 family)